MREGARPRVQAVEVRSSSSHALVVAGGARPLFTAARVLGAYGAGALVRDAGTEAEFEDCSCSKVSGAGVFATDGGRVRLVRSTVSHAPVGVRFADGGGGRLDECAFAACDFGVEVNNPVGSVSLGAIRCAGIARGELVIQ